MPFGLTGQGKAGSITPLAITSIQPAGGSPAGGEVVDIYGRGFELGMTAKIGGVLCTSLVVRSANSLTCVTPAGSGTCDVRLDRVTTAANATLAGGFTYDFEPSQLNPLGWWRSDLGVQKTGNDVTKWVNQGSGAHADYDLVPIGASPTFNAADANFNGQPSITFAAGLVSGTISVAAPQTVIMIARAPATTGHIAFSDQAGNHWAFDNAVASAGIYSGSFVGSGVVWQNVSGVLIAEFNGASSKVSFNDTSAFVTGDPGADATFTQIGVGERAIGGFPWVGEIAELLLLTSFPSAGELAGLRAYVNARYGLAAT